MANKWHTKVRRDANHVEIMTFLRKDSACSVIDLAALGNSVPDLIVSSRGKVVLIEIKTPEGKIYLEQLLFLARWNGYVGFATTIGEAWSLLKDPDAYCLSPKDKMIILGIALDWQVKSKVATGATKAQISVSAFDKEFAKRRKM